MTQQEWEVLNSTMGYSPQQDTAIRESVRQAVANGATVPAGYQTLLPSAASWMPGVEQSAMFAQEVDAFGTDGIDNASTDVLSRFAPSIADPANKMTETKLTTKDADGNETTVIKKGIFDQERATKKAYEKAEQEATAPVNTSDWYMQDGVGVAGGIDTSGWQNVPASVFDNHRNSEFYKEAGGAYIPGNDSLAGNYYGDEVSGDADNSAFGGTPWGGRDTTPVTMYHPSGATVVVQGPEEAALYQRNGYFTSAAEAQEDGTAEMAFQQADTSQSAFNAQWDAEQNSLSNTFDWQGGPEGPMSDEARDAYFAEQEAAKVKQAREYAAGLELPHMIDGRNALLRPPVAGPKEETPKETADRKYAEWEAKMKAEGQVMDLQGSYQSETTDDTYFGVEGERGSIFDGKFNEGGYVLKDGENGVEVVADDTYQDGSYADGSSQVGTADQSFVPEQFETKPYVNPVTEEVTTKTETTAAVDAVNKNPATKAMLDEALARVQAGQDAREVTEQMLADAQPYLGDYKPGLFKALAIAAGAMLFGADPLDAITAGFAAHGQDLTDKQALAAEIAKEDRETANKISVKAAEHGFKAPGVKQKAYDKSYSDFETDVLSKYLKTNKEGVPFNKGLRGEVYDLLQQMKMSGIELKAAEKRAFTTALEKAQAGKGTVLGNWYQNTVLIDKQNSAILYTTAYMDKEGVDEHNEAIGYMSAQLYGKPGSTTKSVKAQIAAYYEMYKKEADANSKNTSYVWKGRFPAWMRDKYTTGGFK